MENVALSTTDRSLPHLHKNSGPHLLKRKSRHPRRSVPAPRGEQLPSRHQGPAPSITPAPPSTFDASRRGIESSPRARNSHRATFSRGVERSPTATTAPSERSRKR